MHRLGLYHAAYRKMGGTELTRRVFQQAIEDDILTWASAMAYSWMLALFPMILFLLTLVAFLPLNADRATHDFQGLIDRSLPPEAAKLLTAQATDIIRNRQGSLLTVGAVLTLWAASGGIVVTMSAINRCYDIRVDQPFYIARPKAILLTVCGLALLLLVLVLLPVMGAALSFVRSHGTLTLSASAEWGLNIARWGLALSILFVIASTLLYFGPRLTPGFRFITPGSALTVLGWIGLAYGFRLYFHHFGASYGHTYGAVGGAVILLLFMYLVSVVLLIGAELNSEFDHAMFGKTGGRARKPTDAEPPTSPQASPESIGSPAQGPPALRAPS
jgi:membrane protein